MSVLLRALLVVAALTYFAPRQQPSSQAPEPLHAASGVSNLSAAWTALPAEARDPLARAGAAEFARRLVSAEASRDTLGSSDRRPAWRGVAGN